MLRGGHYPNPSKTIAISSSIERKGSWTDTKVLWFALKADDGRFVPQQSFKRRCICVIAVCPTGKMLLFRFFDRVGLRCLRSASSSLDSATALTSGTSLNVNLNGGS